MRRSSRSVKAPELFKFDDKNITTTNNDDDEDNKSDDNNDEDNHNDDSDDDEIIFDNKKRKASKAKKPTTKKSKKISELTNDDDDDDAVDNTTNDDKVTSKTSKSKKSTSSTQQKSLKKGSNSLYDIICANPSKKALEDEIESWVNRYRINKIAALVIIVNFVLISSGAKRNWIESDTDLDALDADEISELLNPMVVALTKGEDESRYYPLAQNVKSGKVHAGKYRESYNKFWTILNDFK
jgi:hypothetical protein